jgi:tRNA nucleotidyltransferase (CCA-adding enzyme)
LASPGGTVWLGRAIADGLLQIHLPSATPDRVAHLTAIDQAVAVIQDRDPALYTTITTPLRPTITTTLIAIAKLTAIISEDREQAEQELKALKFSKLEWRSILDLQAALDPMSDTATVRSRSVRDLFFWFKGLGETFPAWCVAAIASGVEWEAIAGLLTMYRTPEHPIAHPLPFVDGKTLVAALDLPRGPIVGELLTELAIARAEGKVSTEAEAIQLAPEFMQRR